MPKPKAEPTGERPVLLWIGDGSLTIPGVATRDFTDHQLNRLVYIRTVGQASGRDGGLYPGDKGFDKARQELLDLLVFSGLYALPE